MKQNHLKSRLVSEIIKGVEKLYGTQPEIRNKLKLVFLYFEGYESKEMEKLAKYLQAGKPFKCTDTGFKSTQGDGEILIAPGRNINRLAVYLNDEKICGKIKRGKHEFSFKIYVNLGDRFPSLELNFPA